VHAAVALPTFNHVDGLDDLGAVGIALPCHLTSPAMPTGLCDRHKHRTLLQAVLSDQPKFIFGSPPQEYTARLNGDLRKECFCRQVNTREELRVPEHPPANEFGLLTRVPKNPVW